MKNKLIILFIGLVLGSLSHAQVIPNHYIVKLSSSVNAVSSAKLLANEHGLALGHVYTHIFKGFSAKIPKGRLKALLKNKNVESVAADRIITINADSCSSQACKTVGNSTSTQVISTGISRVNADVSSIAAGDGSGVVDVDIAILDTLVDQKHPDLNVHATKRCIGKGGRPHGGVIGTPKFGAHGTHVAGIAAAIDNDIGVVGVAPGARIWSIRVLNDRNYGTHSSVICGLDYVAKHADSIEVANMSLGEETPFGDGNCNDGDMREAICKVVSSGVTVVVGAGNRSRHTLQFTPAGIPEVITVSALSDSDGTRVGPDNIATFSNYGASVIARDGRIIDNGVLIANRTVRFYSGSVISFV